MMGRQRIPREALQLTSRSQKGNSQCHKRVGKSLTSFSSLVTSCCNTPHMPQWGTVGIYRNTNSEGGKPYSPLEGAEAPRAWAKPQCFISSLCPHATWLNCRHSHTHDCHCRVTKASAFCSNNRRNDLRNSKTRELIEEQEPGQVKTQRAMAMVSELTLQSQRTHRSKSQLAA